MRVNDRLAAAFALAIFAFAAPAALALSGPSNPPPGGFTLSPGCPGSCAAITGGGQPLTYSGFNFSVVGKLYWSPDIQNSTVPVAYSAAASNLAGGTIVLAGTTTWNPCGTAYEYRVLITVTNSVVHIGLPLVAGPSVGAGALPVLYVNGTGTNSFNAAVTHQIRVSGSTGAYGSIFLDGSGANCFPGYASFSGLTAGHFWSDPPMPPVISKSFASSAVSLGGSTRLTLTITNPNDLSPLNGVGFTDTLPSGLVVASTPNVSNTCSGTPATTSGSVSLTGASLAATGTCTVAVDVTGTTSGLKNNTVTATSSNGGTSGVASASVTVASPPTIQKSFGAASIPLGTTTSLTFTINNPNTISALTGVGFTDTLPGGLLISTPNGSSGTCGSGTITAGPGTGAISLSGATLAASAQCMFSVNVTALAAGDQNNVTGAISSVEGGTGGTASASVNVVAPPSIAKSFNPTSIPLNGTTSLTFTITNPATNTTALSGVAFTDVLPAGLTVPNTSGGTCGGTLTTTAPTGIALSGATIASNAQCQFNVIVTGAANGDYTNTTGSVTSANGGTGNFATANLTVQSPIINSITPNQGTTAGGQTVTINGVTLEGATSVTFDGAPATITGNTTISITVITPGHAAGAVDVVAMTPNGNYTATGGFTYINCTYSLSTSSLNAPSGGMSGTFNITTASACPWQAVSDSAWLTTSSSGTGSGSVSYTIAASTSTVGRSGTITAGGQTFTVTQPGVFPSSLVASTASPTSISLTWNASSVDHFEVWRDAGEVAGYEKIAEPTTASYLDTTASPNSAYVYKVLAVDSAALKSEFSNRDLGSTFFFTNDPISVGVTRVRAVHINELRLDINIVRTLAHLGDFVFGDPSPAGVTIKLTHITQMRSALDEARTNLEVAPLSYTNLSIGSPVSGVDIMQLRNGVR